MAHRTPARLKLSPLAAASSTFPSKFIENWAASEVLHGNQWSPLSLSVLDPETGQSLEHRALRRHPQLGPDWNTSYSNELGRLCQGIGVGPADSASLDEADILRVQSTVGAFLFYGRAVDKNLLVALS